MQQLFHVSYQNIMASFSSFKTLEDALNHFQIFYETQTIIADTFFLKVPTILVEEIEFTVTETAYNVSEAAICEAIIYPILKSLWRNFKETLFLWSHKSITKQSRNTTTGIPDYVIAKKSPLGKGVMDLPMLVMIEAKKDNFDEGWGQCVAQMHTVQNLNKEEYIIYGIVSNGDSWEFGQLSGSVFTKNTFAISLGELQKLYNALYFVLQNCEKQLKK